MESTFDASSPNPGEFEEVNCYQCGSDSSRYVLTGEDDLTGKPGQFRYVECLNCGLVYQSPRVATDKIKEFYDEDYIAHRERDKWGAMQPFYDWAMGKHDRDKISIVEKYVDLSQHTPALDVGCAVGSFLIELHKKFDCPISGVDFKRFDHFPGFDQIDFHQGFFYDQKLPKNHFELITMWHFLEHCYDPLRTLKTARELLTKSGVLIIEVPRYDSLSGALFGKRWPGVQAPQHTVIFSKKSFVKMAETADLEMVEYLPYGAFPDYFYFYAGTIFLYNQGKGIDLKQHMLPYFLGQAATLPFFMMRKKLNLSMQTLILRRP